MSKVRKHTCCNKEEVKMGAWSPEEDEILRNHILAKGLENWTILPQQAGLRRCAKSCRLRWLNYLRPDLKRGPFSDDETRLIVDLHQRVGNKWSYIATQLPGRSDNEIKNFWNTTLKKALISPEQNLQAADSINNVNPPPPPPPQQQYQQQHQQIQQQLYMNLFYSLKKRFFDSAADRLIDNDRDHGLVNHVAQEVMVEPATDNHDHDFANDHVDQEDQEVMAQGPEAADQSLLVDGMPSDDLIKECLQVYNQFFPPTSSTSQS